MSRTYVYITHYLDHDDPAIARAAREAYDATMRLHRLVEDAESSGEVGPGPDETSQPRVGDGTTAPTSPESDDAGAEDLNRRRAQETAPASPLAASNAEIREWARSVGMFVSLRGPVHRDVRAAYTAAMGVTT